MSITLGRLKEIEEQRRAGIEPDYRDADEAAEAEQARQAMAVVAGRFASQLAAQVAQGRQFSMQLTSAQEAMRRQTEMGQAVIRQVAPITKMAQALNGNLSLKIAQDCASKNLGVSLFGIKPHRDVSSALFGIKPSRNVAGLYQLSQGIGKHLAGLMQDCVVNGGGWRNYERARRLLRRRGAEAAAILEQLDDVPLGTAGDAAIAAVLGDPRALARLRAKVRTDPDAARLLAWVANAKRALSGLAQATIRYLRLIWRDTRRLVQIRGIDGVPVRRLPNNQARPPCRDMVKLLHAPRPPHASTDTQERRPILSVAGG